MSNTKQDITGLEALEYQMARNVAALKQQRQEARFSNSLTGRLTNIGGCLFALYCVYRIFVVSPAMRYSRTNTCSLRSQAIINLLSPPRTTASTDGGPRTDFIAVFLAYLLSLVPAIHVEHEEIALMARQINLALVGVIILSSIRLVLRGVARVSFSAWIVSRLLSHSAVVYQALRVTSRNLGASLMLLMLAQLMVSIVSSEPLY